MNLAEFIDGHRDQHLAELYEFLRIPSVSAKSEHKPDILILRRHRNPFACA